MAGYVLRQWQVDCSVDAHLTGPEYRLWLADASQLDDVGSAPLAPGFQVGHKGEGGAVAGQRVMAKILPFMR